MIGCPCDECDGIYTFGVDFSKKEAKRDDFLAIRSELAFIRDDLESD